MLRFWIVDAIICAAICLRLIMFARDGRQHRPLAAALAYVLTVATGGMVIAVAWLAALPLSLHDADTLLALIGLCQTLLISVLAAALFAVGGNVVELFRPVGGNSQSALLRWLRRETWI